MLPDDPRHGTLAGYSAHRRTPVPTCEPCKEAMAAYERSRQTRRYINRGPLTISGVGTRRRIQALAALGWTLRQLDTMLGQKVSYTSKIASDKGDVYRATAQTVEALYDRLSMTPAIGWMADRQRRMAASRGWLPPLAWDDETIDDPNVSPCEMENLLNRLTNLRGEIDPVVVERILTGEGNLPANLAEKREVVRLWPGSRNELERLTGWNIQRYIEREGAA